MKFFNIDCHISVIEDLKTIFRDLGHEINDWSISGHVHVMNKQKKILKCDLMSLVKLPSGPDFFYSLYKNELKNYDCFICCYPPAFSLLYRNFNKPIIIQIPIRYEHPFSNNASAWSFFNDFLHDFNSKKMLIPVANSIFDKEYFEAFTGIKCHYIPNLCEYTSAKYSPSKQNFIYYAKNISALGLNEQILGKDALGENYSWSSLYSYKGIIHYPYQVSTMSIFEQYSANVPLFFPDKNYLIELYKQNLVLQEYSWNKYFNFNSASIIRPNCQFDPNDYNNIDSLKYWTNFSDYYNDNMRNVILFSSKQDLQEKLLNCNLLEISDKMKEHNKVKKENVYTAWQTLLEGLQ
jgi:hypothetical protein